MSDAMTDPTPGFEADALARARLLFDAFGELPRIAFVDEGRGTLAAVNVPVVRPEIRKAGDPILALFCTMLARRGARGVAVASEAWTLTGERQNLPVDFSTDPDRREIVMVVVEHYDLDGGMPRVWQAEITRDASGHPTLGAFARDPLDTYQGRMIGLLPPQKGAPCA